MIELRDMREDEYPDYRSYFIEDYSREIEENYGYSADAAKEKAAAELKRSFPDGLGTPGHSLLCIDAELGGEICLVGYLLHAVNARDKTTFIYDFYVMPDHRGKGYGRQAIEALESQLSSLGVHEIKLRVAYKNQRALKLYQEAGFRITGYNMSKGIEEKSYEP